MRDGYLTLARKKDEAVILTLEDGRRIEVLVANIRGDNVQIAFNAPRGVKIWRSEVQQQIDSETLTHAAEQEERRS